MPFPRPIVAAAALAALAAPLAAPLAAEAASVFCGPGRVTGAIHDHLLRYGDSAAWVAVKYGVHPVRVSGASRGHMRVDSRRVTPRFPASVNGLVLNVPECHVYLVHGGRVEKDYPVAVSTPDNPVPLGTTAVVSKQKNPTWFVPASIQKEMKARGQRVKTKVPPGPGNPLGPRWIGFWNGSFGMHGTNAPTSIKRYASHGCVRFRAADVIDLYERVWVGTPIRVVYQPVMLAASGGTVWMSAYPDVYKKGYDYRGAVATLAAQAGASHLVNWGKVSQAIARKDGILRDVGPGGGYVETADPAPGGFEDRPGTQTHEAEPIDPETGLTMDEMLDLPGTVYEEGGQQPDPWYTQP
jgi:L,D-transpeptidase ErfK/SrfK